MNLKKEYSPPVTKLKRNCHIENACSDSPSWIPIIVWKQMLNVWHHMLGLQIYYCTYHHSSFQPRWIKNIIWLKMSHVTFSWKTDFCVTVNMLIMICYKCLRTIRQLSKNLEMLTWFCFEVVMVDTGCGCVMWQSSWLPKDLIMLIQPDNQWPNTTHSMIGQ